MSTPSESEHGIFNAILRAHIDFTSDPWPSISPGAKDLVRKMLNPDPKQRLTAFQVLSKYILQLNQRLWHKKNYIMFFNQKAADNDSKYFPYTVDLLLSVNKSTTSNFIEGEVFYNKMLVSSKI
jgi:serine/threonine protein kinase